MFFNIDVDVHLMSYHNVQKARVQRETFVLRVQQGVSQFFTAAPAGFTTLKCIVSCNFSGVFGFHQPYNALTSNYANLFLIKINENTAKTEYSL